MAMKLVTLAVFMCTLFAPTAAQGPAAKVVTLLIELKAKAESDGKSQQQSYDKFACWCERTMTEKATAISDAKTALEEMQKLIMELNGELGTHKAEIAQLKKDIATNEKDTKDAIELRGKQNKEYDTERSDSEACIGALEMAIKALTGAGEGGFLQKVPDSIHETELMSVVEGVRKALATQVAADHLSVEEMQTVKHFVQRPEDFSGSEMSALQKSSASNPNGDYAPASGQIQGILKGMYDAFTADLEKANVEEAMKQKAFESLMDTKKQELATLTATLEKQTADESAKKDLLAKTMSNRDSTAEELDADEVFFAETKEACKNKAKEWATVTRLRTMEIQGMGKAIEILTSPEAQKTFASSGSTFLQMSSVSVSSVVSHKGKSAHTSKMGVRAMAVKKMRGLAKKFDSMALAQLSVMMKAAGHFDKVIAMCDKMIETLRAEEKADIEHKDRCEAQQNANTNEISDLQHTIKKTDEAIGRMKDEADAINVKIETAVAEMGEIDTELKELLDMRNEEETKFKKALEDDMNAKALMESALEALTSFYKKNKIPVLLQGPSYSVDKNKAPDTDFGAGGRSSQTGGIVSIMSMLIEDLQKEIDDGKAEDDANQADYEADRDDLQATKDATDAAKVKLEKDLADKETEIEDAKSLKAQKGEDLSGQMELMDTLAEDCEWIKKDFAERKEKRKAEIDGLMEAKNILGGAEVDDDLQMVE